MRSSLTKRAGDRGVVAVEFALIVPLFAALLFGILEYGWIFYQQFNLASAVRNGLRQGVTISQTANPDPRAFSVQRTQADLQTMGVAPASVTLTPVYNGTSPTRTLTLTAVMAYQPLIGLVPTPPQLRYAMTMMLELQ
ncbi:MAG: TadE family protein [Pseudomonadota bacterium]